MIHARHGAFDAVLVLAQKAHDQVIFIRAGCGHHQVRVPHASSLQRGGFCGVSFKRYRSQRGREIHDSVTAPIDQPDLLTRRQQALG
jgi:hypothetical protein